MVHFKMTLVAVAFIAQVGNVSAALTLKVLVGTNPNACKVGRSTYLKDRLVETGMLAEEASRAMKLRGVERSDAFSSFLGDADPSQMDAQHYDPVASFTSIFVKPVANNVGHTRRTKGAVPATETLFICLPANDARCSTDHGTANGNIAITNSEEQTIKLCPLFFEKQPVYDPNSKKDYLREPRNLLDAKRSYLAGEDVGVIPALTLLHEVQHANSVVGNKWVNDLFVMKSNPKVLVPKIGTFDATMMVYYLDTCIRIPAKAKRKNAQNIAWFAMDVYADSSRGRPSPVRIDYKRPPWRRFEAISQRRNEKKEKAKEKSGDAPKEKATENVTIKAAAPSTPNDKAGSGKAAEDTVGQATAKAASHYTRPHKGLLCLPASSDIEK